MREYIHAVLMGALPLLPLACKFGTYLGRRLP